MDRCQGKRRNRALQGRSRAVSDRGLPRRTAWGPVSWRCPNKSVPTALIGEIAPGRPTGTAHDHDDQVDRIMSARRFLRAVPRAIFSSCGYGFFLWLSGAGRRDRAARYPRVGLPRHPRAVGSGVRERRRLGTILTGSYNLTGQITQNLVEQSRTVAYLLLYKEDSSGEACGGI
jgi:hypothetical protein